MSEIANVFAVKACTDREIVFSSPEDLKTFFDDITDSKYVEVSYPGVDEKGANVTITDLFGPGAKLKINSGELKIRAIVPQKPQQQQQPPQSQQQP